MTTTCQNCKKQFVSTSTTGVPQKYCSSKCRNKSANERRFERYRESILGEAESDRHPMEREPLPKNEIMILTEKVDFLRWYIMELSKQQLSTIENIRTLTDIVSNKLELE